MMRIFESFFFLIHTLYVRTDSNVKLLLLQAK